MFSCSKVEEETGKEDGKQESSLGADKTLAALEPMPVRLN